VQPMVPPGEAPGEDPGAYEASPCSARAHRPCARKVSVRAEGTLLLPEARRGGSRHPTPQLQERCLSIKRQVKSWRRTRMEAVRELAGCTVEVEKLRDMGFTTEDLARVVYEKVQAEDLPNFLRHIRLDADGGIDRIGDIWDQQKVFWFFVLVGSVLFNVANVLALNWTLCQSFVDDVCRRHGVLTGAEHVQGGLAQETLDLVRHIPDPETRTQFLTFAVLVAFVEVSWVLCAALQALCLLWSFVAGGSEYAAFTSISQLFQDTFPRMSTFSAISLMARVHPSLIYAEYQEAVTQSSLRQSWAGILLVSAWFYFTRALCAGAAVSAFAVKMVATTIRLFSPKYGRALRWLYVLALINQCMGCVHVERVLQERIFLFVFGGHDTDYQDDERALRSVYMCRVAKEIWRHFWKAGQRFKAVVLLSTFDHYDMQRLIIEDIEEADAISRCASLPSGLNSYREDI